MKNKFNQITQTLIGNIQTIANTIIGTEESEPDKYHCDYQYDYLKLVDVLNSVEKEVQVPSAVNMVELFCSKHKIVRSESIVQEIRLTEDYVRDKILAKQIIQNLTN